MEVLPDSGDCMTSSHLISEQDASELTKVSVETLARFVETGCLVATQGADGKRYFSRSELVALFRAGEGDLTTADEEEGEESVGALLDSDIVLSPPRDEDRVSFLNRHLVKLSAMIRMQEQLLEVKNREIEDLKHQREWLQSRIEKLEEQSDRDRILLLSEAQTIKQLVMLEQHKRSPWRVVLDYLRPGKALPMEPQDSKTVTFAPKETIKPTVRAVDGEDEAA